jgi:hypothetical protein
MSFNSYSFVYQGNKFPNDHTIVILLNITTIIIWVEHIKLLNLNDQR